MARTETVAMSRKRALPQLPCSHQQVHCAGFCLDLWLATAADGRAATASARAVLARHYGLTRPDFQICRFDHVDEAPHVRLSQSHTHNLGAVLASGDIGLLAVGVDVERADRSLRAGAQRHFLNAEDGPDLHGDLLAAWVAKEAVFKAIDPHRAQWTDADLLLSRLWLRDGAFGLCGNPTKRGQYVVAERHFAGVPLRVGVAVLTPGSRTQATL